MCIAAVENLDRVSMKLNHDRCVVGWVSRASRLGTADLDGVTHRQAQGQRRRVSVGYAIEPAGAGSLAKPPYVSTRAECAQVDRFHETNPIEQMELEPTDLILMRRREAPSRSPILKELGAQAHSSARGFARCQLRAS
jgi:hypothetical protein